LSASCPLTSIRCFSIRSISASSSRPVVSSATARRYRSSWSGSIMYIPLPTPRPRAVSCTYPPSARLAAIDVLYGDLSALKRTSRFGRKILPGPNSGSSSASSSTIGARTLES